MNTDFVDYVVADGLREISGVQVKRMFGGYGIFYNTVMFGLVMNDQLYFKVDELTKKTYKELDSRPFGYQKNGSEYTLSYWLVPDEIIDDRMRLVEFARGAIEVAICKSKNKLRRAN